MKVGGGKIPVRSEIRVGSLRHLQNMLLNCGTACTDDGTNVNHGTFLANKNPKNSVTIATAVTIATEATIAIKGYHAYQP